MKTSRVIFAFTMSILLCASARAELKWEQNTIELHPALADKEAVAHFKYQNVGKTPVRLKSVHASCGCTAAKSQQDEVPPGDKGEITATFTIGDRTGTQVKTVSVETDDPAHPTTVLTLKAVLPETLTMNPAFVFWKGGEEPKPKTIVVKAGKDFPAKNLKVTASNAEVAATVEPAGTGEWKINVQPKQTNQPITAVLTIQPEGPNLPARVFNATVSVTAAPPSPPPVAATTPAPTSAKP